MAGSPEPSLVPSRMITPERKLEALQHVNKRRGGLSVLGEWAMIFTIAVALVYFLAKAFWRRLGRELLRSLRCRLRGHGS